MQEILADLRKSKPNEKTDPKKTKNNGNKDDIAKMLAELSWWLIQYWVWVKEYEKYNGRWQKYTETLHILSYHYST